MTAYYNEIDPFAAQWLRNLIASGLIAPGVVDERSITDVRPSELAVFTQCHFFAGIGGWSLALRLAGWPDDEPVWTGSCPCQPFSVAGKGKGAADERHLWPVWFDLIRECRPSVVFGEQVAAAVGHNWLDAVQGDLEGEGYAIGSAVLGAHSVGAPHIRQRLWFVAERLDHTTGARHHGPLQGAEGHPRDEARVRVSGERRTVGGVADACSAASERDARGVPTPERGERGAGLEDGGGLVGHRYGGAAGLLADAHQQQRHRSRDAGAGRWGEPSDVGADGILADADNQRLQRVWTDANSEGRAEPDVPTSGLCDGAGVGGPGPLHGFWRDADWLFCRDGKWRPTQSALLGVAPGVSLGMVPSGTGDGRFFLSPLVQGAPSRVGRLRGYGNAIVPQVAAGFIEAYREIVR